jgi:flagellin
MGLTVTNVNTLSLLNILNKTSAAQSDTLMKLSTGYRINKGSDDPAGMIALQGINAELISVDAAISFGARAKSMLDVADSSLKEVSSLLSQVQTLVSSSTSSGSLSASELAANQSQIDGAIQAIDRIVQSASFNGKNLLDGNLAIRATASDASKVSGVRVYSRPSADTAQTLNVNVTAAGAVASATFTTVSAASLGDAQFNITGKLGTATITVNEDDTFTEIRDKVIAAASDTGVSASIVGSELRLQSRDYGSASFLRTTLISGDTQFQNLAHTKGTDAKVTINGQSAYVDGLHVSFNSAGVSGEFSLTETGNAVGSAGNVTVDGGGATFQLGTSGNSRSTIGLNSTYSHDLGDSVSGYLNSIKSGGSNDLSTNANKALEIVKKAITQVATAQGRIGGFSKFQIETAVNSLNSTKEALVSARSTIRDIDYAAETAELSRQNVLMQSAISLLGVANQQSGQILALLR